MHPQGLLTLLVQDEGGHVQTENSTSSTQEAPRDMEPKPYKSFSHPQ